MSDSSDDFDKLLDDFISSQLQDAEDDLAELQEAKKQASSKPQKSEDFSASLDEDTPLAEEEKQFFRAYSEFIGAVTACGEEENIKLPSFSLKREDLLPRFRPSRVEAKLKQDILKGWDVLLAAQPTRLSSLPENPSDEQILNFAEKTTDKTLQLALISYVETLIEVDSCEIAYNMRRAKYEKHKIEKKIYEEHQNRKEKIKKYIEEIRKKNFPVDAERLVNNFFKTYRKDPKGAQQTLENNPATFAPILIEKIPARFFGMIKAKPEDGFKINKKLGRFLKDLKA